MKTKFVLADISGYFLCSAIPGNANLFNTYDDAKANIHFGGKKLFVGKVKYDPQTRKFKVVKWQDGAGNWLDAIENDSPDAAINRKYQKLHLGKKK